MKKIVLIVVFTLVGIMNVSAQDISFDFENSKKEWWTKYKDIWSISNDRAAEGTKSLKFSCSEFPSDVKNMQILNSGVQLTEGTYTINAKIFIEEGSEITGFNINLKKPFTSVKFKLKKVSTGKWVDISQEMVVEKDGSNLVVAVSTNPKWGGKGVFYLDDIKISKK